MEALVTRILELSSQEQDLPVDVVDLGGSEADTAPATLQQDNNHHPPSKSSLSHGYTEPYTNGTTANYDDTSSYSKVVNLKGLSSGSSSEPPPRNRASGCCA